MLYATRRLHIGDAAPDAHVSTEDEGGITQNEAGIIGSDRRSRELSQIRRFRPED